MTTNEEPKRRAGGMAGGCLLAVSLILGVVVGTAFAQPSIGLLTGFGVGLLLCVIVWLLDRRR